MAVLVLRTDSNARTKFLAGDGCRYPAEAVGTKVQARIVRRPLGSPSRYRLALSVNGADLPDTRHERLRWAQEGAAEYCGELAGR